MMKTKLSERYLADNDITLVGTFSRLQMVKPWFDALRKMKLPRKKIILFIFNNSDCPLTDRALTEQVFILKKKYKDILYYHSKRRGGSTMLGQDNDNFYKSKLKPIWEMWNDLKNMIPTELFFLIEDDTIAPKNAFYVLLEDYLKLENCGFVTGIETGRQLFEWFPVRLGVHHLVRKGNKVIKRLSLDPNLKGVQEIDCSGVFCFICNTELYKQAFEGMNKYVDELPFFAMDNILTHNIKKLGYKLYADFSIWCDHLQCAHGKLVAFNKRTAKTMGDIWVPEFNNYAQGIEIKPLK